MIMVWVTTAQWALGTQKGEGSGACANPPSWRAIHSGDGSASTTAQCLAEPKMKPGQATSLDLDVLSTWSWVPPSL